MNRFGAGILDAPGLGFGLIAAAAGPWLLDSVVRSLILGQGSILAQIMSPNGEALWLRLALGVVLGAGFLAAAATRRGHATALARLHVSIKDLERARKDSGGQPQHDLPPQDLEPLGAPATGLVHDFNNILGAIIAYTEALLHRLPQGREREMVQKIAESGRQGATLAQRILETSPDHTGGGCEPLNKAKAGQPDRPGKRVLLVESDAIALETVDSMLSNLEYQAIPATGAIRALELFHAAPNDFDLVITGQWMVDIQGLDLAREIRGLRDDIVILLVTDRPDGELAAQAENSGIDRVIAKPVSERRLAASIKEALADRSHMV